MCFAELYVQAVHLFFIVFVLLSLASLSLLLLESLFMQSVCPSFAVDLVGVTSVQLIAVISVDLLEIEVLEVLQALASGRRMFHPWRFSWTL